MLDTTISNCIFEYPDIMDTLFEYLSNVDVKNLSLTHSSFTDNSRRALFCSSVINSNELTSFAESNVAKYVIKLKVDVCTDDGLDLTSENFWHNMPNLKKLMILYQPFEGAIGRTLILPHDLMANLKEMCCENVAMILPDVVPRTLNHLDLYNCEVENQLSIRSCCNFLTLISCHLTLLPVFKDSLAYLDVSYNRLTELSHLPRSLVHLQCSNNNLRSLPDSFPSGLLHIDCSSNKLSTITHLPPSLKTLICDSNDLKSLPVLPSSVYSLSCVKNRLNDFFSLPNSLPQSLEVLDCSRNGILNIHGTLPPGLLHLNCSSNGLSSLPDLPSSLRELNCSDCLIGALPVLPSSLIILECSINRLTSLPSLPDSLQVLDCVSNPLNSLPQLPDGLQHLNLYGIPISALSNALFPSALRELSSYSINHWTDLPSGCNKSNSMYIWKYGKRLWPVGINMRW